MPSSHGPDADFDEILFVREHTTPRRCSETAASWFSYKRPASDKWGSRALLQPVYSRAHSHNGDHTDSLNGPLRVALTTLVQLLDTLPSRRIPLSFEGEILPSTQMPILSVGRPTTEAQRRERSQVLAALLIQKHSERLGLCRPYRESDFGITRSDSTFGASAIQQEKSLHLCARFDGAHHCYCQSP